MARMAIDSNLKSRGDLFKFSLCVRGIVDSLGVLVEAFHAQEKLT